MSYDIRILRIYFTFFTAILAVVISFPPPLPPVALAMYFAWTGCVYNILFLLGIQTYRLKTFNLNNKAFIKNIFLICTFKKRHQSKNRPKQSVFLR